MTHLRWDIKSKKCSVGCWSPEQHPGLALPTGCINHCLGDCHQDQFVLCHLNLLHLLDSKDRTSLEHSEDSAKRNMPPLAPERDPFPSTAPWARWGSSSGSRVAA